MFKIPNTFIIPFKIQKIKSYTLQIKTTNGNFIILSNSNDLQLLILAEYFTLINEISIKKRLSLLASRRDLEPSTNIYDFYEAQNFPTISDF